MKEGSQNKVLAGCKHNYVVPDQINYQLQTIFANKTTDQTYQLSYIIGKTADRNNLTNLIDVLKPSDTKSVITSFFNALQNGLDVSRYQIPSLKLDCCDINVYFDVKLFNGPAITTYTGPRNAERALGESVGIVIFSDDVAETKKICAEIKSLLGAKPKPFIFIGTSVEDFEINVIKENIAGVLPSKASTSEEGLAFWNLVREQLDKLARLANELYPPKEAQCRII